MINTLIASLLSIRDDFDRKVLLSANIRHDALTIIDAFLRHQCFACYETLIAVMGRWIGRERIGDEPLAVLFNARPFISEQSKV